MNSSEKKKSLSVAGEKISFVLDASSGFLRGITNKQNGDGLLKALPDDDGGLFLLAVRDEKGKKIILEPPAFPVQAAVETEIKEIPGGKEARINYRALQAADTDRLYYDLQVTVTLDVYHRNEEAVFRITVINKSHNLTVVEVLFPRIRGVVLGSSWEDDILVYPHHAGEKITNPVKTFTSKKYRDFFRAAVRKDQEGIYTREINYCGLASMQWMDYYDPGGGLYLASYDPEFHLTGLRAETPGPDNPWMGFAFRKYVQVKPGYTWQSGEYCLGAHQGDWHWGAVRYRRWFDTVFRQQGIPPELKLESSINPQYDFKKDGVLRHRFADIPAMYDRAARYGMKHFFIASWNRSGFDTDYPEYHPDLELGTPVDLERGCRYITDQGGLVTFYLNARIFDVESDYFAVLGKKWALKDSRQCLKKEAYGPRNFAVLCPACPDWRKHLADFAAWMVRCYHARGIYLDQLGSAEPYPCYDEKHGHSSHGEFNRGYLALLKEVGERIRAENPDAFLMIENCGDIYSSSIFASLTWNAAFYDEFFNLYKYTFPEHIQVNMVHPRRIKNKRLRHCFFYQDIERALLLGSIFWGAPGRKFQGEDEVLLAYFAEALTLRKKLAPFFSNSRFIDTDHLDNPGPAAATHWLPAPETGYRHMVVLGNRRQAKGQTVTLQNIDQVRYKGFCRARLFQLGRKDRYLELPFFAGEVRIEVPEVELSAFLIE